jgi:hypothetical protein
MHFNRAQNFVEQPVKLKQDKIKLFASMVQELHNVSVQNGSGAHPASYLMGTRVSFPGSKAARA